MNPEEFHQCIWLQGFWLRYSTFNALQVVVMDQHHIAGRGVLCDSVKAGYPRAMTQQIYSLRQYTPTECEGDPDTSSHQ
jgi:hypothetical protein